MKVKAGEMSRRIKKAQQEGRAFLSYIGKPEEEENLPSEYVITYAIRLPVIADGPVST